MLQVDQAPRVNILLVAEGLERLSALEEVLAPGGQRLVKARSGAEAFERMLQEEFACVLVEVRLPGLEGLATTRRLKAHARTRQVPVLLLSAEAREEGHVLAGYAAGAVDYLLEPYPPAVLRAKVASFVELHRQTLQAHRAALRAGEARFRRIFESNLMGLLFSDYEGRILEANEAFLSMVGYTREELKAGRVRWDALTPPQWHEANLRAVEELKARGETHPFEKEYLHKDGRRVPVLVGSARVEEQKRNVTFVLDLRAVLQQVADSTRA